MQKFYLYYFLSIFYERSVASEVHTLRDDTIGVHDNANKISLSHEVTSMTQYTPINPSHFRFVSTSRPPGDFPIAFVNGGFKFGIGTPSIEIHHPRRILVPCQRLRLAVLPVRCCNWPRFRVIYQWTVSRAQIYLAAAADRFRKPDETATASCGSVSMFRSIPYQILSTIEREKRALDCPIDSRDV